MLSSEICCDGSVLALLLGQYLNVNLSYRLQSYAVEMRVSNLALNRPKATLYPVSLWPKFVQIQAFYTLVERKRAQYLIENLLNSALSIIDDVWQKTNINIIWLHFATSRILRSVDDFANGYGVGWEVDALWHCHSKVQWRYPIAVCSLLSTDMYSEASCPLIAISERDLHGSIAIKTVLKFSLEILKAERTVKQDCGSCGVLCNRQERSCKAASCARPQYPKPFSAVATVGYGL